MTLRAHDVSRNERRGLINGALGAVTLLYALWGIFLAGLLSGCGYQFTVAGPGPTIGGRMAEVQVRPEQVPSPRLVIQTFDNTSFEPTLAAKYTEYFRREFAAGSGAKVVSSTEAADLALHGKIESVYVPSLAFTRSETFESRAVVTVSVRVQDLQTKKVVWEQRAASSADFFVTDRLQFNQVLQQRAVEQAGEQIASDLAVRFLAHLESTAQTAAAEGNDGRGAGGSPPAPPHTTATDPSGSDDPMRGP